MVAFIGDEEDDSVGSELKDIIHPCLYVVKGESVGDVVKDYETVFLFVMGTCDVPETLLSRAVPNLNENEESLTNYSHMRGKLVTNEGMH